MSKRFLIGNFLPAYGLQFGRVNLKQGAITPLSKDQLQKTFDQRTKVRRERRVRYVTAIQISTVCSLGVLILAFSLDISVGDLNPISLADQEIVMMEEIAQTMQVEKPPPPPRPPVPVEVPNDVVLDDEDFEFDAMLDIDAAVAAVPPPPDTTVAVDLEPEIFLIVESPPEMVGGYQSLAAEVKYPSIALRTEISGTVVVRIIVGEDGLPSDATVVKSVHEMLDNEAMRAVLLQTFVPGKQRGRPVPVYMQIPVRYRIR
jgi:protein TonB